MVDNIVNPFWHLRQGLQFVPAIHLYLALVSVINRIEADQVDPGDMLAEIAYYGYTGGQVEIDFTDEEEDEGMVKTAVAAPEPPEKGITEEEISGFVKWFDSIMPTAEQDPFEGFDLEAYLYGREDDHA